MFKFKTKPKHSVFLTVEEALANTTDGQIVGVGFPLAHNVYRVSEGKDKEGNPQKKLNFSYHYI